MGSDKNCLFQSAFAKGRGITVLYLLPNLLHPDADAAMNMVTGLAEIVNSLDGFFVETPKEARKFLKHFDFQKLREKPMKVVDKRTEDFSELLRPLKEGQKWGMLSDAGLPCIADPGSRLVFKAKEFGISVKAIPGPSSIYLSLLLSGLPSQRFIFHGYVPRKIEEVEKIPGLTRVFIETPYKNVGTIGNFLDYLSDRDLLSVACDLTLSSEEVVTKTVKEWRRENLDRFRKRPAVILIHIPRKRQKVPRCR